MQKRQNAHGAFAYTVGHNVRRSLYDQFPRAFHPSRASQLGKVNELLNHPQHRLDLPFGSEWGACIPNIGKGRGQLLGGLFCPENPHRLTRFGAAGPTCRQPPDLFVIDHVSGFVLPQTLLDQLPMVGVQRQVLSDSFIKHETPVSLLHLGKGVESQKLLLWNTKGDGPKRHAASLHQNTHA